MSNKEDFKDFEEMTEKKQTFHPVNLSLSRVNKKLFQGSLQRFYFDKRTTAALQEDDLPDFCCSFKFSNKKTFHLHFNWLGVYTNDGGNVVRKLHQTLKAVTDGKLLTLNVLGQQLNLLET